MGISVRSHLRIIACARLVSTASSSSSSFPFPTHPRPTPWDIFHLPHNASQQQIKDRYYELVRAHHPDSPSCRLLTSEVRHARFQAIAAAYDSLRRGRRGGIGSFDPYTEELARRRHIYYKHYHRRHQEEAMAPKYTYPRYDWNSNPDDRWKDYMIIGFGVISLVIGIAPGVFLYPYYVHKRHQEAVFNLSQARSEARLVGEQRMREMRNRANELKSRDDS
ncbi:hypothetical protein E1B28_008863 [Marasmius oreades]|uniref:J domain-containing protein n=1 Tax=Marasmius oreades TaxID=181124 RepID=A0A9P7RZV7_9AGAR|nr:uncharacterized protein E1B28_008863 [Marasmius oreades]KAG7092512.1 hypothetical protein E1B28_008863 [Marasmius oreades]